MAEVQRIIDAPPERVWAVLADGWLYAGWVVGTPHVRKVDDDWPQPGAKVHHASGGWPLLLQDVTEVHQAEPPRLLVMKPQLWPLGSATVTVRLSPVEGGRTQVRLGERFEHGPLRWALVKANDLLLHRRNVESLRRLANLAANRPR